MLQKIIRRSRSRRKQSNPQKEDPLKLTAELQDITSVISKLVSQKISRASSQHRRKRLKTFLRNSMISKSRKSFRQQEHNNYSNTDSFVLDQSMNRQFTMIKCSVCSLYFPVEKLDSHFEKCRF